MTKQDLPSPELLRKLLRYEPETGKLFWLRRDILMFNLGPQKSKRACSVWNSRFSGKEAFTALNNSGYKNGTIFKKSLLAHRVIWAMVKNKWPEGQIDHINGERTDNRICNLQDVCPKQNSRNRKITKLNTTGVTGVTYCKRDKVYVSCILKKRIGSFKTLEEARSARLKKEAEYKCFSDRHGR